MEQSKVFQWFRNMFCVHADAVFICNISGDGLCRSVWKCGGCGAVVSRVGLHGE